MSATQQPFTSIPEQNGLTQSNISDINDSVNRQIFSLIIPPIHSEITHGGDHSSNNFEKVKFSQQGNKAEQREEKNSASEIAQEKTISKHNSSNKFLKLPEAYTAALNENGENHQLKTVNTRLNYASAAEETDVSGTQTRNYDYAESIVITLKVYVNFKLNLQYNSAEKMSLISVHRSPSPTGGNDHCFISDCTNSNEDLRVNSSSSKSNRSLNECYFTVRGAAVILSHSDKASVSPRSTDINNEIEDHLQGMLRILRPEDTLSMAVRLQCSALDGHTKYLAILSTTRNGDTKTNAKESSLLCEYKKVRQSYCRHHYYHRLNSSGQCHAKNCNQESALLGFDFFPNGKISIGVIVPIERNCIVELDGDGGISVVDSCSTHFLFKPVSIQSMWSLFQYLHKELAITTLNVKPPSPTSSIPHYNLAHSTMSVSAEHWRKHYGACISSEDTIRAEWHYSLMDEAAYGDLKATSQRSMSTLNLVVPTCVDAGIQKVDCNLSSCDCSAFIADKEKFKTIALSSLIAQEEAQTCIRSNLKYIMQSVDLDNVTSKDIRSRLEACLKRDVNEFKEFIDREMLAILGQLDKPSKIFDYLYLGTEWNASNWEELKLNSIEYILNVTKEVDNFFPAQFQYLKIWVSDEANTELLRHWQRTYDFIKDAKEKGSVVLVHCKKGISRSSSTVIAYVMKEYGWSLEMSLDYVKNKRNCITPNVGFIQQLQTFYGVLQASNNRHSAVFNTNTISCMHADPTTSINIHSVSNTDENSEEVNEQLPSLLSETDDSDGRENSPKINTPSFVIFTAPKLRHQLLNNVDMTSDANFSEVEIKSGGQSTTDRGRRSNDSTISFLKLVTQQNN